MNLNLSAWIARREKDIGPYADHIIAGVKEYEREIERLHDELHHYRSIVAGVRASISVDRTKETET